MEENEELESDFTTEDIPISEEFWNYMENYWHNNREFPESTEASLNKKADLIDGKVPSSQLPNYVDDVLEFNTFESLPNPGEKGKIYVVTNNNTQFRWSGSEYIRLNSDENVVTITTNQDIIGRKSFITAGGNGYNNNSLRLLSNDGSNPGLTFYKGGVDIATMYFDGTGNFKFKNSDDTVSRYVFAQGFKKDGSSGSRILLGDGTDRPVTDFTTVTGADAKYIPYAGATANINLNAKPITNAGSIDATVFRNGSASVLVKSFSLHNSTSVTSLGIKLTNTGTSIMMGSFTITIFGYVGQTISFRVSMYKYNNTWFNPTVTWLHGDSSKLSNIEFYKENDTNLHLKVNFATNFGTYNKTVITDVLANGQSEVLHNPDTYTLSINPDNSAHTLVQTTSNNGFVRDTILSANSNHITTNTAQTGLIGDKTSSGTWTFGGLRIDRSNLTDIKSLLFRTNNISRWAFYLNNETGSGNVGGDFTLSNYSDTGAYLSDAIKIRRNDGNLQVTNLSGTGNRMVIADSIGRLSSQTIPDISSYLPLAGGTISGGINFSGELTLQRAGVTRLRTGSLNTIVSSEGSGQIYFRPQGDAITTGQLIISNAGSVVTSNDGTSVQWNTAYNWGNHAGKYFPRSLTITTIDLSTLTLEGIYYGYQWIGAPTTNQTVIATVTVKRYSQDWIRQEFNRIDGTGITYVRDRYNGTTWSDWKTIADRDWVNSALNSQLNGYAKLSNIQTFTGENTFTQAVVVPNGTLVPHAVNLGQMTDYVDSNNAFMLNHVANNYISTSHEANNITATNISNWNTGFTNNHTHANKVILDGTQESFTTVLKNKLDGLINYTLSIATSNTLGGIKLITDTVNNIAPNAVTTTINRSYAVQLNNLNQAVVNVPWSDTNTTYTGSNGITLTGTNFTPTYGTSANTVAQGNDSRINNGQTAFGWGNHATAGYTSQSWVQSQNYATNNFVEEKINDLKGEIVDPTPSFSAKNEFTTVIITENFSKESLELKGELIPGRYISIINLSDSKVELTRDHNTIDTIYENETSEYYITQQKRLVRKGTYKSAKTLI